MKKGINGTKKVGLQTIFLSVIYNKNNKPTWNLGFYEARFTALSSVNVKLANNI